MRSALQSVPGVRNIEVSLKEKKAVVAYDADKATVDQLLAAIKKAGFEARVDKGA